jgi:glutathione S-transferase
VLGLVWIAARILYVVRYIEAANRRGLGFTLQGAVCVVLLVGAVAGIVNSFVHGG